MKVHIKALCLLLSGLLIINIMSFGGIIYAAAAPYVPGVAIPIGQLSPNDKTLWDKFCENFSKAVFGSSENSGYNSYQELYNEVAAVSGECIEAVPQEDGTIDFTYIEPDDGTAVTASLPYVIPKEIANSDFHITSDGSTSVSASSYNKALYNASQMSYLNNLVGPMTPEQSQYYYDNLSEYANSELKYDTNGKPQNVTTVKSDLYISVFDTLGLEYTVSPSLLDYQFNMVTDDSYVPNQYYTPFFITSDNKLYLFRCSIETSFNGDFNRLRYQFIGQHSSTSTVTISYNFHYPGKFSFRFVDNSGHLYFCLLTSSYFSNSNTLLYYQYTNGKPGVSNAPMLFYDYRDRLDPPSSAKLNIDFINNALPDNVDISFINSVDNSDFLTDSEILSADIIAAGCFNGQRYDSTTFNAAGQMLLSSENAVSGGNKTITSDLTDWQKAIYILAQEQKISYEQLLEQMKLVVNSDGTMSIEGLDGLTYSVDNLAQRFDDIIGTTVEINEELSKTLEYLKSLNLEELNVYVQSIQGILDGLNSRDEEDSAVLGDIGSTLTDLKEQLKDLDVEGISSSIKSIDETITKSEVRQQAEDDFHEDMKAFLFDYQVSQFKLYDQCKYFLDNLFNYSDHNKPPTFQFYYDSNGDGEDEVYTLLDLSFLDTVLTNENMVDKSFWASPIKVIDLIRYVIAIVCYGLFVMRLIKRLPSFYGNGPLSFLG